MRGPRKALLVGAVATLLVEGIAALVVIGSGVVDVAAVNSGGFQDRILAFASTRSIARHARRDPNPLANDPAAVEKGLRHYAAMCAACHGGPGVTAQEFAAGLHPPAPDLASPEIQSFTDGMLYETVSRGIGSTGMPAFGPTHPPEELWSIVAFLRRLPALTPPQKAELARQALEGAAGEAAHSSAAESRSTAGPPPGQGGPGAAGGPPGQRIHHVSISSFKFDPPTVEVRVGDLVEWQNQDFVAHTATADDKSFDTGRIDADQTKRVVVKAKGRFPYSCRYHPAMKGTVVVE